MVAREESAWPRGLPYAKGDEGIDFAIDTTTNVERVLDDAESVFATPPVYSSLHVQKERGGYPSNEMRRHPIGWTFSLIASLSAKQHHFAFAIASSFTVCWSPP